MDTDSALTPGSTDSPTGSATPDSTGTYQPALAPSLRVTVVGLGTVATAVLRGLVNTHVPEPVDEPDFISDPGLIGVHHDATCPLSITCLQRKSLARELPDDLKSSVGMLIVEDHQWNVLDLTIALGEQHAVVSCLSYAGPYHGPEPEDADAYLDEITRPHKVLAEAACHAGVKRYIPSDFGVCNSRKKAALHLSPLCRQKAHVLAHCNEMAKRSEQDWCRDQRGTHQPFNWTSFVCGYLLDWGIHSGALRIDVIHAASTDIARNHKCTVPMTTLSRLGEAVAREVRKKIGQPKSRNVARTLNSFWVKHDDLREFVTEAYVQFSRQERERVARGGPRRDHLRYDATG